AYDRVTHQLVLFGGYDGTNYLGDTWTWDGSDNSWTHRQTATHPPKVTGPMLFTDPLNGHVDMFWGFDGMFYQNGTWEWTGTDWTMLDAGTPPARRESHGMAWDPAMRSIVMFGGQVHAGPVADDTWAL